MESYPSSSRGCFRNIRKHNPLSRSFSGFVRVVFLNRSAIGHKTPWKSKTPRIITRVGYFSVCPKGTRKRGCCVLLLLRQREQCETTRLSWVGSSSELSSIPRLSLCHSNHQYETKMPTVVWIGCPWNHPRQETLVTNLMPMINQIVLRDSMIATMMMLMLSL